MVKKNHTKSRKVLLLVVGLCVTVIILTQLIITETKQMVRAEMQKVLEAALEAGRIASPPGCRWIVSSVIDHYGGQRQRIIVMHQPGERAYKPATRITFSSNHPDWDKVLLIKAEGTVQFGILEPKNAPKQSINPGSFISIIDFKLPPRYVQ